MASRKILTWATGILLCLLLTGGITLGGDSGRPARAGRSPCFSLVVSRDSSLAECWNFIRRSLPGFLGGVMESDPTTPGERRRPSDSPGGMGEDPGDPSQVDVEPASDALTDDPDILP